MELARKTTILLTPGLHDRLTRLARQRGTSMGALIRDAVVAHYGLTTPAERLAAVRALAEIGAPVGSVREMKAQSMEAAGDVP